MKGMENLLSENPDRGNSRTFFVPNDEAFKKLDENVYNRLMSSPAYMKEVPQTMIYPRHTLHLEMFSV